MVLAGTTTPSGREASDGSRTWPVGVKLPIRRALESLHLAVVSDPTGGEDGSARRPGRPLGVDCGLVAFRLTFSFLTLSLPFAFSFLALCSLFRLKAPLEHFARLLHRRPFHGRLPRLGRFINPNFFKNLKGCMSALDPSSGTSAETFSASFLSDSSGAFLLWRRFFFVSGAGALRSSSEPDCHS